MDALAEWAGAASPIVATVVFVTTIVLDRRRRSSERYRIALDQARRRLIEAGRWTVLPASFHALGWYSFALFNDVSSFALELPRRCSDIAEWLVRGVEIVSGSYESSDRVAAQTKMVHVLFLLANRGRQGFGAAREFVGLNPWPAELPPRPAFLERCSEATAALIQVLTGDRSFGRLRSHTSTP